ncbi:conserved protein of unknown function [Pseudodesulfovibrio profundus]|uniref:Uncharacterized protein n=1 Tax=Pseudodesulfovibrio profundus TaxID=57320 RepID=A0A2C8FD98_9BACT|nr:hypothetical protein [Pseudodesulfovibrio profundus]SOB60622.1 conserved protein of unknown function [Pseudodesulfovibrio profundus]
MSKFEGHTPGPWVFDKNLDVSQGGKFTSDQDDICFVNHEVGDRDGFANYDTAKANAALIAAAPDMYDALKDTLNSLEVAGADFTNEMYAIRQVLAKAKGEK